MKLLYCFLFVAFSCLCVNAYGNKTKDSTVLILDHLAKAYQSRQLSEKAYLDTINSTMRSFLSIDVDFTNKELLQLLGLYRKIAWNMKNGDEYKRQYYGILSNQAEMAGRDGEMLYYGKKINDLEQKSNSEPSITALTIITGYYNTYNSYDNTKSIYENNKKFILDLPSKAGTGKMKATWLAQTAILLDYIGEALFELDDTLEGSQIVRAMQKIAETAKNIYHAGNLEMANILYAQNLLLYERAKALNSKLLFREAFKNFDIMLESSSTPEYLKRYIQFTATDKKLMYYLKEKNIDSTAHYLAVFDHSYKKEAVTYNLYNIYKYKALALYNKGLYKESADTLQSAIKVLDSSRSVAIKNINDMMYARAEAEENQLLLEEATIKRKRTEKQLYITGTSIAVLLIAGLFTILYIRRRQKNRFLGFKLHLARNVHDETGPALLYAKTLAKSSRNGEAKSELEQHIEHTMEIIRSLAHDLKSDKQHTLNDLIRYTEETLEKINTDKAFTYIIDKTADGKRFISHYQFSQIKSILNECITNSVKHADFDKINIAFKSEGNKLIIDYADNGQGWPVASTQKGIGIRNMKERLEQLNGELSIRNNYPDGYNINLAVMLR